MIIALLLIPYTIGLIVYGVLSAFALMHLVTFGVRNFTTFLITVSYIALSVIVLYFWYAVLAEIPWEAPMTAIKFFYL
ncbi:hypothetical protein HY625_03400 [Candidatus Uhrbacteria bacterium]|nr:hypothetical protein [Candidatus Uhrbacteria bacterium]